MRQYKRWGLAGRSHIEQQQSPAWSDPCRSFLPSMQPPPRQSTLSWRPSPGAGGASTHSACHSAILSSASTPPPGRPDACSSSSGSGRCEAYSSSSPAAAQKWGHVGQVGGLGGERGRCLTMSVAVAAAKPCKCAGSAQPSRTGYRVPHPASPAPLHPPVMASNSSSSSYQCSDVHTTGRRAAAVGVRRQRRRCRPARAGQRRGPIAAVDRLVRMLSLQWSCLAGPETQQARGDAHTNQALARRARCPHADPPPSIPATLACPCRRCRAQAPRHSHKSHTCTHSVCISMRARARCMHNAASRRAAPHAPLLAVPPLAAAAAALAHRRGRRRLNQQPGKGAVLR